MTTIVNSIQVPQEQVAGDMIEMAHSLRAHTETARDIIRSDVKVLQYS